MSVLLSQFNLFEESSSLHNFRDGILYSLASISIRSPISLSSRTALSENEYILSYSCCVYLLLCHILRKKVVLTWVDKVYTSSILSLTILLFSDFLAIACI